MVVRTTGLHDPPEPQTGSIWASESLAAATNLSPPGFRQLLGLMLSTIISMCSPDKYCSTEKDKTMRSLMDVQKVNYDCWEAADR